jgi:hypothetical protein
MSTWTTPITFTSGSVLTAAQMNTELRDHVNFLKGALDLITNSTTADTGNTMLVSMRRGATTDISLQATVTGDTAGRVNMYAGGHFKWSDGTASHDLMQERGGIGQAKFSANGTANASIVRVEATSGQQAWVDLLVAGDAASRTRLRGDTGATGLFTGPGSSTPLAVVGQRQTGWTVATGTPSRATYATSTVTLAVLAGVVMALEQDLITHGMIGT